MVNKVRNLRRKKNNMQYCVNGATRTRSLVKVRKMFKATFAFFNCDIVFLAGVWDNPKLLDLVTANINCSRAAHTHLYFLKLLFFRLFLSRDDKEHKILLL